MIITKNTQTFRNIIRKHIGTAGTDALTLARTAKVCYGWNIGTREFSDELHIMRMEGELIQTEKMNRGFPIYQVRPEPEPEPERMTNEQILKDLGF